MSSVKVLGAKRQGTGMTFEQIGRIMLDAHGEAACLAGYKTNDPEWVGALALRSGDINHDGTLN